jgi:hypothetical protein
MDIQGSLLDYKTKEHAAELIGNETIGGVECIKLKLTLKWGKTITYFIDTKTYYVNKSVSSVTVNGQQTDMAITYSNYKKTPEGIVLPMSTTRPTPGGESEMIVTKVEVNPSVDEKIFSK